MTNIGAFKIFNKEMGEAIILVADGMGSSPRFILDNNGKVVANPRGGIKDDNNQKLFYIGDHMLMGTGNSKYIIDTALILQNEKFDKTEHLAQAVLEVTDKFGLTEKDGLSFIAAGMSNNKLSILDINTTGNNGLNSDYKKRTFTEKNYIFNGSGSFHVNQYIDAWQKANKDLLNNNLANGLLLAYNFGKEGAIDNGVNDKLQFGIITPDKSSAIFHPDINPVTSQNAITYINKLFGTDFNINSKTPQKEIKRSYTQLKEISTLSTNFYNALKIDLTNYSIARGQYSSDSEKFGEDLITAKAFKESKTNRNQTKKMCKKLERL
jgi:hypothetical protein